MKHGAGVLCVAPDGQVLLVHRKDGQGWALPGGHLEEGEIAHDAALRELHEETGYQHSGSLVLWTRRCRDDTNFSTFLADCAEKFTPRLNDEHSTYMWVSRKDALSSFKLHPGVPVSLQRFDMDELGIARAMREGDLVSPQRFGTILLVSMRITGTGAAYRKGLDEYVWRDSSIYLNDEFLERCQGLPVILEHPKSNILNSDEFRERIIGTIFLPYLKGDEVWGITKIYDDAAKQMLEEEKLSTSPAVVFTAENAGSKYRMEGGKHLLVEGNPNFLDHLAVCELGVWDKGGKPSGVLNEGNATKTNEVIAMADDVKTVKVAKEPKPEIRADDGLSGNKEGDALDKVLSHLTTLHSRMDAFEGMNKRFDDMCSRMDAFEFKGKEGGGEHEPPHEEANLKEAAEPAPPAADAKKDGEEQPGTESETKALETERGENHLHKFDSRADSAEIRDILKKLEARIPVELTEEARAQYVEAQSKAERIAQAFGDAAGAPRWVTGETLLQYRRRLASKYKQFSSDWKDQDLNIADSKLMDLAEKRIYADAYVAATGPSVTAPDVLREVVESDRTGRRVSKFYGSPGACWDDFKQPSRLVTGWNTKNLH